MVHQKMHSVSLFNEVHKIWVIGGWMDRKYTCMKGTETPKILNIRVGPDVALKDCVFHCTMKAKIEKGYVQRPLLITKILNCKIQPSSFRIIVWSNNHSDAHSFRSFPVDQIPIVSSLHIIPSLHLFKMNITLFF